jgi:hypothetical protein
MFAPESYNGNRAGNIQSGRKERRTEKRHYLSRSKHSTPSSREKADLAFKS